MDLNMQEVRPAGLSQLQAHRPATRHRRQVVQTGGTVVKVVEVPGPGVDCKFHLTVGQDQTTVALLKMGLLHSTHLSRAIARWGQFRVLLSVRCGAPGSY
jgi:hypothetical protein